MTALPASSDFTGSTVTEGQFKAAITNLRDYLSSLLGTDGLNATALATLGALLSNTVDKTAAYTVALADRGKLINAINTWALGLPAAATAGVGFSFAIRNSGTGSIVIDPAGAELINGAATLTLGSGQSMQIICTGTMWYGIGGGDVTQSTHHTTYAEPMVGMGGIFLRRTRCPRAEFINDRGRDVYNLFRVLQEHYVAFLDMLRFQITTQANFNRLVDVDPETLTDMQRAARFLFLQRLAFGGKVSGKNFGLSTDRPSRFNLTTLEPDLEALHSRLSGVTVTCMDFADFIRRVDRPETLFYLDPPYWGCEGDYGKALFSRDRFEELATVLGVLKGRFILSLTCPPEVPSL